MNLTPQHHLLFPMSSEDDHDRIGRTFVVNDCEPKVLGRVVAWVADPDSQDTLALVRIWSTREQDSLSW